MSFDSLAFGRRLAAAREWRGLIPKQVATHLDISTETINRWERGGLERPPKRGQLRLLAEILEQSEDWLREGDVPPWLSGDSSAEHPAEVLAALRGEVQALDRKLDVAALSDRLGLIEAEIRRLAVAVASER